MGEYPKILIANHNDWQYYRLQQSEHEIALLHKIDGPALYNSVTGETEWWLYGQSFSFDKWLAKTECSEQEKVMLKLKYA